MARNKILVFLIAVVFAAACTGGKQSAENQTNSDNIYANKSQPDTKGKAAVTHAGEEGPSAGAGKVTTNNAVAKAACMTVDLGGKRAVMKSQTFAVDFEPFKGACFVTTYNPEYGDSHMESQYDIYKDGKKIFSFPGEFNGSTFGCWVDAVAFQDLNHDGLTDVMVVGKCVAKQADYNENMVYMNTGKAFITREDGNNQLGDFKTVKEISDFVEDNQQIFFK
jgi:hypothetical protein